MKVTSQWVSILAGGMLGIVGAGAHAAATCQLIQAAELQVTMIDDAPLISASINGHAVHMLADTGAARSLIWRSAAKELDLQIREGRITFYGAGGHDEGGSVWVHDFALAGAAIHNVQLYAGGRGDLPAESAGLVGEDFLSGWDVEFDLASGKIRLFTPRNCKGSELAYWASSYAVVDLLSAPASSNWIEANVQLNGHAVVAMFDSGAAVSAGMTQALRQSGIKPETPVVDTAITRGLAGRSINTSVALFPTLSIGDEKVQNVELRIADLFSRNTLTETGSHIAQSSISNPEMLIGADFFRAHRIFIARSQGKMYFTYVGGPIFRHIATKSNTSPPEGANPDSQQ